jgi:hypothetical protein
VRERTARELTAVDAPRLEVSVDGGQPEANARSAPADDAEPRMWHVTLSVAGSEVGEPQIRAGLERLAQEHPFLLSARYASDHAEVRYWEQAGDLHDAAALALRVWGEHRESSGLPRWEIVGLEVVDRGTFQRRGTQGGATGVSGGGLMPASVRPF